MHSYEIVRLEVNSYNLISDHLWYCFIKINNVYTDCLLCVIFLLGYYLSMLKGNTTPKYNSFYQNCIVSPRVTAWRQIMVIQYNTNILIDPYQLSTLEKILLHDITCRRRACFEINLFLQATQFFSKLEWLLFWVLKSLYSKFLACMFTLFAVWNDNTFCDSVMLVTVCLHNYSMAEP